MAVNLPPQYHDAEARYKKAQTPEDKLAALREMWVLLPKHKASEKVQADLKTKISELTDQIEHAKTAPKKAPTGATLEANGLSIVHVLMRSSTRLYANRAAFDDPAGDGGGIGSAGGDDRVVWPDRGVSLFADDRAQGALGAGECGRVDPCGRPLRASRS